MTSEIEDLADLSLKNKIRCKWCRKFRAPSQMPRHYKSKHCTIARAHTEKQLAVKGKERAIVQYQAALERLAAEHQKRLQDLDFKVKECEEILKKDRSK